MKSFQQCRLYTFIDTAYLAGRDVRTVTRQLCEGGADVIQLRAKGAHSDQIRELAQLILPITEQAGIGLVINDEPEVARQTGACAVHLGQEDFFDAGFLNRAEVTGDPSQTQLGLSTHAPAQAQRSLAAGPDYIAIGPVYPTATKATALPVTLEYVRWAAKNVSIPWFAIGGITLGNLPDVLAAGATRICVVSAILQAPHIAKACAQFKEQLLSVVPNPTHSVPSRILSNRSVETSPDCSDRQP
jgi:thiamine-phosphate pyrophosphorylase